MVPLRRQLLLLGLKIFDLIIMIVCFFLTSYLVGTTIEHIHFGDFLSMRISVKNFLIFGGIVVVWHIIFTRSGIYSSYRLNSLRDLFADTIKIASFSTLALYLLKRSCLISRWSTGFTFAFSGGLVVT